MAVQPCVYASGRPPRRTILVVEDDPFVLEATCRILSTAGFEVLSAEDSPQAVKIFAARKQRIDLVMTDMVLPGPSGQQLGQQLRQHSPDLILLVTSGYWNPEYETENAASRNYFLPKPYWKRTLLDKIDTILSAHAGSADTAACGA